MRRALAALAGLLYAASVFTFWIASFLAYFHGFSGPVRWIGVLFLPPLALPLVGGGTIAGFEVKSIVWWAWFGVHALLAALAIFLYHSSADPREPMATNRAQDPPPAPDAPHSLARTRCVVVSRAPRTSSIQ